MIKNYFGEKIGLYFLFLGHYTTFLMITAIGSFADGLCANHTIIAFVAHLTFHCFSVGSLCWLNVAFDDNNPGKAYDSYHYHM